MKKKMLIGAVLFGAVILVVAGIAAIRWKTGGDTAERVVLADAGQAKFAVYPAENHPMVLYAARELAGYLQQITGAEFSLVQGKSLSELSGEPLIIVGRNSEVDREFPNKDSELIRDDGFAVRTQGKRILIFGNIPRGTLYGVYAFLDQLCGIHWYAPDYTYVPHQERLELAKPDLVSSPRFAYREMFLARADDEAFRARNRLNGKSHYRAKNKSRPELNNWSTYWPQGTHNFYELVPEEKYHVGGQLTAMDEQMRQLAADRLTAQLKAQATKGVTPSAGFSQEDRGWQPDPASKAFAGQHGGTLAAPILDLVIDVGDRVRRIVPGAMIGTLAYQFSFPPPTNLTIPDYVTVTLAPIEGDQSQPINGPINRKIALQIEAWTKLARNLVFWDYLSDFAANIQPFPNLYSMGDTIKYLAHFPQIQGYFGQMVHSGNGSGNGLDELRTWVLARLVWDPEQDPRQLITEFVNGYYGDAAPYIIRYIELMQQSLADHPSRLAEKTPATAPYLTFEFVREADRLVGQALKAAEGKEALEKRIRKIRVGVDYIALMRYQEFNRTAKRQGVAWDLPVRERMARFENDIKQLGIGTMLNWNTTYDTLIKELRKSLLKDGK
jgi:hypothetical protein